MSTTGSSSSCAIGSISALQQKIETAVAEYPCNIVPDDGKPNFADNVHLAPEHINLTLPVYPGTLLEGKEKMGNLNNGQCASFDMRC